MLAVGTVVSLDRAGTFGGHCEVVALGFPGRAMLSHCGESNLRCSGRIVRPHQVEKDVLPQTAKLRRDSYRRAEIGSFSLHQSNSKSTSTFTNSFEFSMASQAVADAKECSLPKSHQPLTRPGKHSAPTKPRLNFTIHLTFSLLYIRHRLQERLPLPQTRDRHRSEGDHSPFHTPSSTDPSAA